MTNQTFFFNKKNKIRIVLKKPINSHQTDERLTRSAMHKDSNFSGRIRSAQMIPYTLDLVTFKRTAGLEQLSFSSTQKKKARLYRFPILVRRHNQQFLTQNYMLTFFFF